MALKKTDLYSSLWVSCDQLRGSMNASQYKDAEHDDILGDAYEYLTSRAERQEQGTVLHTVAGEPRHRQARAELNELPLAGCGTSNYELASRL